MKTINEIETESETGGIDVKVDGPQRRFHLRSKKRKAAAISAVTLLLIGIVGYQLASLQFGFEGPPPEAIASAEAESPTASPPPLITTYDLHAYGSKDSSFTLNSKICIFINRASENSFFQSTNLRS